MTTWSNNLAQFCESRNCDEANIRSAATQIGGMLETNELLATEQRRLAFVGKALTWHSNREIKHTEHTDNKV